MISAVLLPAFILRILTKRIMIAKTKYLVSVFQHVADKAREASCVADNVLCGLLW